MNMRNFVYCNWLSAFTISMMIMLSSAACSSGSLPARNAQPGEMVIPDDANGFRMNLERVPKGLSEEGVFDPLCLSKQANRLLMKREPPAKPGPKAEFETTPEYEARVADSERRFREWESNPPAPIPEYRCVRARELQSFKYDADAGTLTVSNPLSWLGDRFEEIEIEGDFQDYIEVLELSQELQMPEVQFPLSIEKARTLREAFVPDQKTGKAYQRLASYTIVKLREPGRQRCGPKGHDGRYEPRIIHDHIYIDAMEVWIVDISTGEIFAKVALDSTGTRTQPQSPCECDGNHRRTAPAKASRVVKRSPSSI